MFVVTNIVVVIQKHLVSLHSTSYIVIASHQSLDCQDQSHDHRNVCVHFAVRFMYMCMRVCVCVCVCVCVGGGGGGGGVTTNTSIPKGQFAWPSQHEQYPWRARLSKANISHTFQMETWKFVVHES